MAKYRVTGEFKNYHELTIEAPDEETAVQIFYQQGGGSASDGDWDNIEADFVNWQEDEPSHVDYTEEDYDPAEGKISW